jgi:hypothetical protein
VKPRRASAPLSALAALLAGALPFFVSVNAWPEIVTPAWFVTQGVRLYDGILFPHTPLLILLTAALGLLFGFSASLLRALPALSLAASGALLVLGTRPHRAARSGSAVGLLLGVPLLALLTVYAEGPAIWPEPFLAPFFLAGVLLLERAARAPDARRFAEAGLVFGAALLVKQTAAWAALAALLWVLLRARLRVSPGLAAAFAVAVALPYAGFAASWALVFRTTAHVRWTLVYPVFSGMSREIATPLTAADVHESVALFVPFAALALAVAALPARAARSPLLAVALGAAAMAWPRAGLLHLSGLTALGALAAGRAALVLPVLARRVRRGPSRPARLLATSGAAAAWAVVLGVAALGAGPLLVDAVGGPVFRWDDSLTRAMAAAVKARVPAGGEFLVYGAPHETLYPLTRTRFPGGFYVNPSFWYCLNRDRGDERVVAALKERPGLPVLYRAPIADAAPVRKTRLFAFVEAATEEDARAPGESSWRHVKEAGR